MPSLDLRGRALAERNHDSSNGATVAAAGEVALEASQRALFGFAFCLFASEVFLDRGIVSSTGDRDHVQRSVELAVPATIQA